MGDAQEVLQLHDCFLVKIDIKNSPMAEIPLADMFDMVTSTLLDNYRDSLREAIIQVLEDTMWIDGSMMAALENAAFGMFDVREGGMIISLQTASLQRLVTQTIANREMPI